MSRSSRDGMSLIEVLVVLGIIALLIGMLLPATRRVREASARSQCVNNLKQLALAMHNYYDATDQTVPLSSAGPPIAAAAQSFPPGCLGPGANPEERLSWMVALLPYLEQDDLSKRFDAKAGYAGNRPAAGTRVRTFVCPAGTEAADAVTHYVAMSGVGPDAGHRPTGAVGNGFMGFDRKTPTDAIRDGLSNTVALMETRSGLGPWARGGGTSLRGFDPLDVPLYGDDRPFGGHTGGMNAAMADGSVRFVRSSVEPKALAAAITVAGGEPTDPDW